LPPGFARAGGFADAIVSACAVAQLSTAWASPSASAPAAPGRQPKVNLPRRLGSDHGAYARGLNPSTSPLPRLRLSLVVLASLLALPIAGAHRLARHDASPDIQADTLRIYYVGHPVGYERYSLIATNDGYQLDDDFDYVDRGRRTHLRAATRLERDFTPRSLEITRLTDTSATVETRVRLDGAWADVIARGDTTRVPIPSLTYPIQGHTPFVQQLGLVRYWLANAQPPTLAVVPGDPTNEVRVDWRGRDTLTLGSRRHVLDRYSVEGVVWGTPPYGSMRSSASRPSPPPVEAASRSTRCASSSTPCSPSCRRARRRTA
jgi:hypothetical protein